MEIEVREFNLSATLESGQVFGFTKIGEKRYRGILLNAEVELEESSNRVRVECFNRRISAEKLKDYFDLERDLRPVYGTLKTDRIFCEEIRGLRIIRQNPWEALASFIISSNNNIKRIQLIWNNLCRLTGCFPNPNETAELSELKLRELGLGYRAPYLLKTARRIASEPTFLPRIYELDYMEAKEKLMELDGVGRKVADCVLLFGFQKYEAFPVDVWIARIMRKIYFNERNVSELKIAEFARKRWGNLAGYVQQYLFHFARTGGYLKRTWADQKSAHVG